MIYFLASIRSFLEGRLADLRRSLGFLTEEESRLAFLNQATDRVDLERRMRELDSPRGPLARPRAYWAA
jgi:hypothetical protein